MKLCKTTSVFYYFLAFLYAVAAGGAILGWILSGAASVMFGDLGMVLISAVIIAALVLIFGFIFIYVHGALLLRAPRREDTLIYALYEAAGICFAVLHLCAGMVLNAVGIMNVWLSIVYYGVMLTIPLLGAGAMKQKRQEGVVSDKTTEEQTKKKTVQSARREKKTAAETVGAPWDLCIGRRVRGKDVCPGSGRRSGAWNQIGSLQYCVPRSKDQPQTLQDPV